MSSSDVVFMEDADVAWRARMRGWRCFYAPSAVIHLVRWAALMLAYDAAYVGFVALSDRTLAPLRGRLAGLREWRAYRAAAPRAHVELVPVRGVRAALERWATFTGRRLERGSIARHGWRSR